MCLIKNKKHHPFNHPLIAKEDIICYKVLSPSSKPYHFSTPIIGDEINTIIHMELQIPYKAKKPSSISFFIGHVLGVSNTVTEGFIHTFSVCYPHSAYALFKCVIPKGTKYFVGKDGDYASEQIIFVEQLK
jgi:hypothetical protein